MKGHNVYGVSSLPSTGTGAGLIVASQTAGDTSLMILMSIVAMWTLLACARVIPRLLPKEEM